MMTSLAIIPDVQILNENTKRYIDVTLHPRLRMRINIEMKSHSKLLKYGFSNMMICQVNDSNIDVNTNMLLNSSTGFHTNNIIYVFTYILPHNFPISSIVASLYHHYVKLFHLEPQ